MPAPLTGDSLALRLLYAAWAVAENTELSDDLELVLRGFDPNFGGPDDPSLHMEATADDVAAWLTTGSVGGM